MSMTGRMFVLYLVALLAAVFSQNYPTGTNFPTTTATEGPECMCFPCHYNPKYYTKHVQKHFCDSAAVIQGRVTGKKTHRGPEGIWNSEEHKYAIKNVYGAPPMHYELSVRVLAVYHNQTKVEVGDKIIVRYASRPDCDACETLVENFEDEYYTDRRLQTDHKYIFFLPALMEGFGEKLEGVLTQCSKVWRWSKHGKEVPGYIPTLHRYILYKTQCDMCRVSGCYQNKCVKASEAEECDQTIYIGRWKANVCQPILDHGLCYYNAKTDSCRWTSFSKSGSRSRKPIKQCLPEE